MQQEENSLGFVETGAKYRVSAISLRKAAICAKRILLCDVHLFICRYIRYIKIENSPTNFIVMNLYI